MTEPNNKTVGDSIQSFPQQLKQSWDESKKIIFPDGYRNVENIVVCGMGGSRFPALIIKELFKTELTLPFIINDNYQLPKFINQKTLVILSSYSGSTEEVIMMGRAAQQKKAKITAITSGGELSTFCQQNDFPCYVFNPIFNPSRQPRIGFGYAVGGLLGILYCLGLIKISAQQINQALAQLPHLLNKFSSTAQKKDNPAIQLAGKIYQKFPYYVVSEFLTGVGNAVANQTNETAKSISSFQIIPELNHHLMEGLKHPKELSQMAIFVFFYSSLYSLPIQKRFLITKDVVEQNKIKTVWYQLLGNNKIEQAFELMSFGSYLTMYLSKLYGENPAVVPYVDYFKKRLKEIK